MFSRKNKGNQKKEAEKSFLLQANVAINSLLEMVGKINYGVVPTILNAPTSTNIKENIQPKYEAPAAARKPKSVIRYIEARLECENADDYDKWLSELESDPYLSNRDKQSAKSGTI